MRWIKSPRSGASWGSTRSPARTWGPHRVASRPSPSSAGLWGLPVASAARSPQRADQVIRFIECLTIPSGVGAGRPFVLRDWQKKFIRDVYETETGGRPLVRKAVLHRGRKKTAEE